ncbi:kinase-like protein [Microthyrium microscopicum]|uniref:Kinase-like protein n=1 Tax=Microthyrium microscopicum TaxID=703497 RepID=A0A6A6UVI4_9PEZI|nr:kinase-like protein [Microthyrium microscopicum]
MSSNLHADPPPRIVREPNGIQYLTADQLGKGGFAICYRAETCENHQPSGKIVALKIVKSQMEPQKLAQKFVTELQLHSKIHHPNIVEFHRAFSFEKSTYVVLEICDNGSLADALKKRKFFSMPEIRRFIIQICGAIKYLHHRNIVHRDLKTGNLFLDSDMNIKVGDFGLAAVLVGKNEVGLRRTTMCGTPNYLAPEILEKHGKGHNEKVDLWAIGIIAYTLAVGKAPFHASKREEIYKKLQQREYVWPDLKKHQNVISTDLQDLVGSLLVDEDNRPVPDQIVSHSFFRLHWVPETLASHCTNSPPNYFNTAPPGPTEISQGYSFSWYQACKKAGVGEYSPGNIFPVISIDSITSIVKEIEREIKAGRAPTVPIANGTVYVPFISEKKSRNRTPNLSEIAEEQSSTHISQLTEISGNHVVADSILTRLQPAKRIPSRRLKENVDPEENQMGPPVRPGHSTRSRTTSRSKDKPASELPTLQRTTSRSKETAVAPVPELPTRTMSRSQEKPTLMEPPPRAEGHTVAQSFKQTLRSLPSQRLRDHASRRKEPNPIISDQDVQTVRRVVDSPAPLPALSDIEFGNDPASVLRKASQLRERILSALACKTRPSKRGNPLQPLPFVTKWVDYAKKHGVGYVLKDGTIGCSFNATSRQPVMHAVVRHGYTHLDKQNDKVNAQAIYQIPIDFYGVDQTGKLQANFPNEEQRKRNIVLWSKFSRYMCQTLSTVNDIQEEKEMAAGPIVRFYQRVGTVGFWWFTDGSVQVNFPDHTKMVISADGEYCDFTCLSEAALSYIKQKEILPLRYVKGRDIVSGSLEYLLLGPAQNKNNGNMLRKKLQFIVAVLQLWISAEGLGCRPERTPWPDWDGPKLDEAAGKKVDWVTVGRFGGDIKETGPWG